MDTAFFKDTAAVIIPTIVTAVVGFLAGRRKERADLEKTQAEVNASELENVEKAITIWRKLAEDMAAQVNELKTQVHELTEQVAKLTQENRLLTEEIKSLKK
jgi:peptidoglycan hydrolase CwlO-like protein